MIGATPTLTSNHIIPRRRGEATPKLTSNPPGRISGPNLQLICGEEVCAVSLLIPSRSVAEVYLGVSTMVVGGFP